MDSISSISRCLTMIKGLGMGEKARESGDIEPLSCLRYPGTRLHLSASVQAEPNFISDPSASSQHARLVSFSQLRSLIRPSIVISRPRNAQRNPCIPDWMPQAPFNN